MNGSFELALVLLIPLLAAVVLALFGHHRRAPEINAAGSLATLLAAGALTVRVINGGPITAFDEQFFVAEGDHVSGGPGRGEGFDLGGGEGALFERLEHFSAHGPRGADDGDDRLL